MIRRPRAEDARERAARGWLAFEQRPPMGFGAADGQEIHEAIIGCGVDCVNRQRRTRMVQLLPGGQAIRMILSVHASDIRHLASCP